MNYPLYLVDAFAERIGTGNTAAVVRLNQYPAVDLMQELARELNFSETAFLVPEPEGKYHIRWFTPEVEVALCGHATLASAQVLFTHYEQVVTELRFSSLSGTLVCRKREGAIELDFPVDEPQAAAVPAEVVAALGGVIPADVKYAPATRNLILVYDDKDDVLKMQPDFAALHKLERGAWFGLAVTAAAQGREDYICRYFAPWEGINEDPVTGSAQTFLAAIWADKLGKTILHGYQASARGGRFEVELCRPRVLIRGKALIYMAGIVEMDEA